MHQGRTDRVSHFQNVVVAWLAENLTLAESHLKTPEVAASLVDKEKLDSYILGARSLARSLLCVSHVMPARFLSSTCNCKLRISKTSLLHSSTECIPNTHIVVWLAENFITLNTSEVVARLLDKKNWDSTGSSAALVCQSYHVKVHLLSF